MAVFDEYHLGAWHKTAKELCDGEEEAVAKETATEYGAGLDAVNEDLRELCEKENEFLLILQPGVTPPLLYAVSSNGDGRVHRGAIFQLDR